MCAMTSRVNGAGIGRGRRTPGGGGPGRYIPGVGGIGGGGGGPMSSTGARVWTSGLRAAEPATARSSAIAAGARRRQEAVAGRPVAIRRRVVGVGAGRGDDVKESFTF